MVKEGFEEEVVVEDELNGEVNEDEQDQGVGEQGQEGEQEEEEQLLPVSELQRRLARQQKKFEEELKRKDVERNRDVKKAKMTQAEQRAFDLDTREQELRELEAKLNEQVLRSTIQTKLSERGLSDTYTDFLIVLEDEVLIDEKIEALQKAIEEEVSGRVKSKIYQPELQVETRGVKGTLTREEFNRLGYEEKEKLYKENRDLYKKLI